MKTIKVPAILIGSCLLFGAYSANAACIIPETSGTTLPTNDVSLDGLAFEVASATPPLLAAEVDMNGIQNGIEDQKTWATHGTMVATVNDNQDLELIASWTQNTSLDSVEWVCRLKLEPGTSKAFGSGFFHSTMFGIGNVIEKCSADLVADC